MTSSVGLAKRAALAASLVACAAILASCGGADGDSETSRSSGKRSAQQTTPPPSFFPPNVTIPADANTQGMWSPVYDWPGVAVHAVVLSDGRLLTFGSSITGQQGAFNNYDIWDTTVAPNQGHLTLPNNTGTDIFCSSMLLLPAESVGSPGKAFIAGGDVWTGTQTTNTANQNSSLLDVAAGTLTSSNSLQRARWYSTSTTLINGETYIQGGVSGEDRPEVRSLTGGFRLLSGVDTSTLHYSFPRNYVAPDGRVFGYDTNGTMYYVNTAGNGSLSIVGTLPSQFASDSGSGAMFRPGRILQLGGNSNSVAVIDITAASTPVVTATQSLSSQRQWVNATILADGRVLATSGSQVRNELIGVNTKAEIWNPVTGQWLQGPSGNKPRLYHSNAILLPDASVLVMAGGATDQTFSAPVNNLNAEIYYPSYFFTAGGQRAQRPIIAAAPDWVEIGSVLPVTIENATSVSRVTLVKTGASTHSFNMDQRFLDLTFTANGLNLSIQAPARAADAPPGYYMLFVFDQAGVPSVSNIVRVGIAAVANPAVTPTMTSPGPQTTDVGTTVTLALSASDPNGDALTFNSTGLPPGLTLNAATGVVSGTPNAFGTYSVTVTASDGVNFTSTNFVWTVNAVNGVVIGDLPPVSNTLAGTSATFTATSSGGTNVLYRWNFGDGTADTAWSSSASVTHTFANAGTYNVTVSVTDDSNIVRTKSFVQTVSLATTVNRPTASSNILLQPVSGGNARLWVVNQDNDSVSVFDSVTRVKQAEINVGTAPRSIALAPNGLIWVSNKRSDSISVINPATNAVVNTISLPRASQPFGIAMSPTAAQAFVVLEATGQLLKLDTSTYATIGSLSVGANARHVSVTADGASVYVSRFVTPPLPGESTATVTPTPSNGAEVVQVSASGMSFLRTIVLQHSDKLDLENQGRGIPNYLGAATISPDGTQAWVPSKQDNIKRGVLRDGAALTFQNTVRAISSRIVLSTNQEDLAKRVDHDNSSVATAAAYDNRGVYLFVALETSREVAVVDAHRGFQVMRFNVGRAPQGLALSPDGNTLFVNNFMDRSVGVYDLQPLLATGQLSVPLVATLNAVAVEKLASNVLQGKQHFYDARDSRLARDRYMSCASCHNDGGSDGRTWDFTGQGEGLRNTISLRGRAGAQGLLHWSANFDEVQDFEGQIRALAGGSGLMSDISFNAGTRSQPLGDPKAGASGDLDALAAYVGSLSTFSPTPYRDGAGALTSAGAAGRAVFIAQGCSSCHGGSGFTNAGLIGLQNVGTLKTSSGQRLGGPLTGIDVPTLRDVWGSAPYLHDGSAATLETAVLAHNNVSITSGDLANLVQYLKEIGSEEGNAPGPQFTGQIAALGFNEGTGTLAADQAGTHNGALLNGTAWTAGKYGQGASLDGVDDAISLATPGTIDLGSGNFTVMMWFKRNALGGTTQRHLFSKCHPSAWQSGCKEFYFGGDQLKFGSFATGDTLSVTIADTSWHHVALVFTRSSNAVQIYVDGTLRTSATKALEADDPAHVVMVGNQGGANPFSGLIDEVRIYNQALTATQVTSDMNTPLTPTADTTAPVLSGASPSGTLAAGTTQATLAVTTNENATCRYSTIAGTAYGSMSNTFGSTGGTAHSTVVSGLANGQSYSYYVRCQDGAGNANSADTAISFAVAAPDTSPPTVSISAPASGATVSGTVSVSASATDNVGVVAVQFLLDGVALGTEDTSAPYSVSWTSATAANGSHTLSARARDAAGNQTTSTTVTVTVSNAAPDTTPPTVSVSAPATGATVSGSVTVSATAGDNVGVAGVQFLLDGVALGAEVTAAPFSLTWNSATASNGSHSLTARARDAAGNQTTSTAVSVTVSNAVASGLVAAFGLDEGSGTSSADQALAGHTATLVNGPVWTVGKFGKAVSFDGVNDVLTVANPSTLNFGSASFTVMMWVKRNALGGTVQRHLFSKCNATTWQTGCKELYFSGDTLNFGSFATTDVSGGTIADTNWHHVAVVFDRTLSSVTMYVDGAQRNLHTRNLEADNAAHVINIGNMHGANPFSGLIDEVRIYNQVLTLAQVQSAMSAPLTPVSDTTPPVLSTPLPTGTLAAGTAQATLSVTTNENATCRYATTSGTAYASMPSTFGTTGALSHSSVVTGLTNGQSYSYYVRCQDTAGNANAADQLISFSVAADTASPTIGISAPVTGSTVSGTVGVTASASDNVGVVGVQFLLDGVALGTEDTTSPYSVNWNSTTASNGAHVLTARARDAAGNQTTSTAVNVTVNNVVADTSPPTVSISSPAVGASVSGTVSIAASASDNVGVVGVQFLLDGVALEAEDTTAPYGVNWNTASTSNGNHVLTARARDAAGNQTTSATVNVTVSNAVADTTPPSVSISSPTVGASVSGTVSITVTASDNVGVVGVQFLLDGVALGAEVTAAPFTLSWNSSSASNGSHTLSARARDAAGNQTTSNGVTVTVANTVPTDVVAAFRFDDASGTAAVDLTGAHNGTLVNGPVWATGQYGGAVSFDGVNDAVTVASPSTFNFGGASFTIMMWMKRGATGGSVQRHLFSKCHPTTWESGCKELYFSGNTLNFGSFATPDVSGGNITDTNWHHVAVVFNRSANTVTMYVDGAQRNLRTRNLEADNAAHVVTIGNMGGANPFNGSIDDLRVYNRALSTSEVAAARLAPL